MLWCCRICLSFFAGTQFGLAVVGDFVPDYTALKNLKRPDGTPIPFPIPEKPEPLPVSGRRRDRGPGEHLRLMFAISGITIALSSAGRSRWKVTGYAVLIVVVMFVANTIGQLWEPAGFVRPFTLFFYYQPQKAMLDGNWLVDLGAAWSGAPRRVGYPDPLAGGQPRLPGCPPRLHSPRLAGSALIGAVRPVLLGDP